MADTVYSVFEYLYRDASNYKQFGTLLLVGAVPAFAHSRIGVKIDSDGIFVPSLFGLPSLAEKFDDFPTKDDHIFHEFISLRAASLEESASLSEWGSVQTLIDAVGGAPFWDTPEGWKKIDLLLDRQSY